jgi:RNA polymerase sigma-B factor
VSTAAGPRKRKTSWTEESRAREKILLETMDTAPKESAAFATARDELITMHIPLVEHLARRFRDRGEPHDDLVQVGMVGLIKSADRFDSGRGVEFSTYATPTIVGEIKRHFRDRGWSIRVPRRLQESGHSPTVAELAAHLGISQEEVLEGLESAQAYSTLSLDSTSSSGDDDSDSTSLTDTLGDEDVALEGVEYRESLKPLLAQLSERERNIIMMRFFKNMTQAQIAEEVGVSQMHVSRLLSKALTELRAGLTEDAF